MNQHKRLRRFIIEEEDNYHTLKEYDIRRPRKRKRFSENTNTDETQSNQTEPQKTEPQKTEPQKTEQQKTEPQYAGVIYYKILEGFYPIIPMQIQFLEGFPAYGSVEEAQKAFNRMKVEERRAIAAAQVIRTLFASGEQN